MASQVEIDALRLRVEEQARVGQLTEAESSCLQLLESIPDDAAAWFKLGTIILRRNRLAEAEGAVRNAVALDPAQAIYWGLLGSVCYSQQRYEDAVEACRKAIALNDQDGATWGLLAAAKWAMGDLVQADEAYQRSLQIDPYNPSIARNYARLLLTRWNATSALGTFELAVANYKSAVRTWLAAGKAFLGVENPNQAMAAYQKAINLEPTEHGVRHIVVHDLARYGPADIAESLIREIEAAEPGSISALALRATFSERQVRVPEAAEALRSLLLLDANAVAHSKLLGLIQYGDGASPDNFLTYHQAWNRVYAERFFPSPSPWIGAYPKDRRIRIGFVSSDFRKHPNAYMVLPLLEHLDKDRCDIFCYYPDAQAIDDYTVRFKNASSKWHVAGDCSDDDLVSEIRNDNIDILIDLIGHNGKRLLVFARKPASIQMTWFGYVGTTGLRAMDFLLADRFHVAEGEEHYYSERVLRMPHDYACYEPPATAPDVDSLPALKSGTVTFGCLNNPAKIGPMTIDSWAKILDAIPNSQLLLKYRGYEQEQLRDRIKVEFSQHLINPSRILFEGFSSSQVDVMGTYNKVDIALDTHPYSGGLTTCEALWMGVPVITFPGKTFASRHSFSHLTNAGYPQFVAQDQTGYVELAIQWATRLEELALVRSEMRERMRLSPLCDARQFARDFVDVLEQAWTLYQTSLAGPVL